MPEQKAMRLREANEKEASLGFAKVTKATVIPAGQRKEIHVLTKIKHGDYGVNLIGEVSGKHPLPQGLDLMNSYCNLTPGSAKVNLVLENTTRKEYNNSCQSHCVSTESGQSNSKIIIAHK